MVMKMAMGAFLALGILFLVMTVYRMQRIKRFSMMLNAVTKSSKNNHVQKLKEHHETEMVLEKENISLSYFRKLDSNSSYKIGLLLILMCGTLAANAIFQLELGRNGLVAAGVFSLVFAIVLPGLLRSMFVKRRVRTLSSEIPWLVDLLAICVQCGMTVEVSFAFLSQKMSGINPDFTPFLDRLVKRTDVSGLSSALKQFYIELPSVETRMLCAALEQSLQYGSSLYDQLVTLSRDIREVQLLATEEKIGNLGAKMSVPLILFFMFPVVIIVAAPGVMRIFSDV